MLQRKCSGSLYRVLEVDETATTEEIKRSYRQLAIKFHPDKTNGDTTEQFALINEARDILTDPKERKVYDIFGKAAVDAFRNLGNAGVLLNPVFIRVASVAIVIHILLNMLSLVFVIVRLDYNKKWPWAAVFSPSCIALAPFLPIGCLLLRNSIILRELFSFLLGLACLVTTIAFITFIVALSGKLLWTYALLPCVVLYILICFSTVRGLIPSHFRRMHGDLIDHNVSVFTLRLYWFSVFCVVCEQVWPLTFIIFGMVRAAQADWGATKYLSFWWVFAPLIIYFGGMLLFSIALRLFAQPRCDGHTSYIFCFCQILVVCVIYGGPLFAFCMLAAKCEYELNNVKKGLHPSAAVVILPYELFLAFFLLCFGWIACFVDTVFEKFAGFHASESSENIPLNKGDAWTANAKHEFNQSSGVDMSNDKIMPHRAVDATAGQQATTEYLRY